MKLATLLLFAGALHGQAVTDVRGQWNFLLPPTGVGGVGSTGYCASTSTSGLGVTWSCTPSPALTSLSGAMVTWIPDVACGASPTLNVNTLGAKAIKDAGGSVNLSGCAAGSVHILSYNGTNWLDTSTPANILVAANTRGTAYLYMKGDRSCIRWTQTSAQLISGRTSSTSVEDDFVIIPANAVIESYTYFTETTAFAGSSGLTISMQAHGNSGSPDLIPTCTLQGSGGHTCPAYLANPSQTAQYTASIAYVSLNAFSNITQGTGTSNLCVSQGQ